MNICEPGHNNSIWNCSCSQGCFGHKGDRDTLEGLLFCNSSFVQRKLLKNSWGISYPSKGQVQWLQQYTSKQRQTQLNGISDQSLRCPHEDSYPLSAQRKLWSDWADAQTDLSLRWAHMPYCWFCHEAAQKISRECHNNKNHSPLPVMLVHMPTTAHSENSDHTGRMPRLIWVFAGRTCHIVGFVMRRLKRSPGSATIKNHSPLPVMLVHMPTTWTQGLYLIRSCIASYFWNQGKQCRPRSDAKERGAWLGFTLFSYKNFY